MIILKLYTAYVLPITLLKYLVKAYSFYSILLLQHTSTALSSSVPIKPLIQVGNNFNVGNESIRQSMKSSFTALKVIGLGSLVCENPT